MTTTTTVSDLVEHVDAVCRTHGIAVEYRGTTGRAWHKRRRVRTPNIKSDVTYLLALHEVAHVVCPKAHRGSRLEREYHAWRWALDNAIGEPSAAAWRKIRRSLEGYFAWARRCQHRKNPAVIPPAGHPIYDLLAEAKYLSD